MAVYKHTYKAYSGALTPAWSRFTVLSRYGFSTVFGSRPFTAYMVICMVPFLVGLTFIYFIHRASVQGLLQGWLYGRQPGQLGLHPGRSMVDAEWFLYFLAVEAWMGFLATAWVGPGMITKDFANQSVQLYLSRPLSRPEYLLGKASVLGVLLSCTTWIPALLLFGLQAVLEGGGWGWQYLWIAGSIIIAGLMYILFIVLFSMAVSVWVRWRIAATALMLAIFFVLPGLGQAANVILNSHWGMVINFPGLIVQIWFDLFRMPHRPMIPGWAAWASILFACSMCIWMLNSRLRAREVERA